MLSDEKQMILILSYLILSYLFNAIDALLYTVDSYMKLSQIELVIESSILEAFLQSFNAVTKVGRKLPHTEYFSMT
jgi:hypothetical protein